MLMLVLILTLVDDINVLTSANFSLGLMKDRMDGRYTGLF